jgi:hypothetical protein
MELFAEQLRPLDEIAGGLIRKKRQKIIRFKGIKRT